jgi:hypothetical protein
VNTKLFGQFLLERGYVTREQLLDGLEAQRSAAHSLGDLAVATGMLGVAEVDAINLLQHLENKPFSQAALELGLLTQRQLAELLHPNSAERLLLGQILLAFGHLDPTTLAEALEAHTAEGTDDDTVLMAGFRQSDLVAVGPTCVSVLRRIFTRTVRAPVSFRPLPATKAISASQTVWSQGVVQGGRPFLLALQVGEVDACVIATAVLGVRLHQLDDLARDAVGEFLNVVTGHVCANLEAGASATPPRVQRPGEFLEGAAPGIALLCSSDETEFSLVLARPVEGKADAVRKPLRASTPAWTDWSIPAQGPR